MKQIIPTIISILFCLLTAAQNPSAVVVPDGTPLGHIEYYKLPSEQEHYSSPTRYDYSKVAGTITEGCGTDFERLRAINQWIGLNIAYDTSYSIYNADDCFDHRRGVCQAYCELFYRIAEAVGIRVEIVSGTSRDIWGNVGGGHAWLFAYTRPDWGILIDPTWDAGSVSNGSFSFRKHPGSWFAVDAEWMILRHFPKDESYQLLDKPMSRSEFESLRGGFYLCAEYGMDVHQIYIRARKHTLSLPEFYSEGEGEILRLDIPLQSTLKIGETYTFRVRLNTDREFVLQDGETRSIRSDAWVAGPDGTYTIRYTPSSEGAVILGFREAVSQHAWRTRICVRYRVTS